MGHQIKGQWPHQYRPSATRRASGLNPIRESNEKTRKRWIKVIQKIKTRLQIERNIRTKGAATRGRFTVRNASPPKHSVMLSKNKPPGIYFVTQPYKRGRFKVEDIYGFVPFPPKKRTNAKSP